VLVGVCGEGEERSAERWINSAGAGGRREVQMVLGIGFVVNRLRIRPIPALTLFLLLSCHHTRKKEHGERVMRSPESLYPLKNGINKIQHVGCNSYG
jgi:hypothetical protein